MPRSLGEPPALLAAALVLLAAPAGFAQQAEVPLLAPQPAIGGARGGYGGAQLFSPFPKAGDLMPPSLQRRDLTPSAEAGREFSLKLTAGVEEQWSDNVYSASSGAKADFITSATPSVIASLEEGRVKAALDYNLGYDKYAANPRLDGFRHEGLGSFNAEMIAQTLFLDGRASISQQLINPAGPVTAGNRTAAGNLTQVITTSLTPSLQHRFGAFAVGKVSYHHEDSVSQNISRLPQPASLTAGALGGSSTDGGRIELRNGERFAKLLWDYAGDLNHHVSGGTLYDQLSQTVGLEYKLTPRLGLLGAFGDDYLHGGDGGSGGMAPYGGFFYDAGLHWTPSALTDLRLGTGRRYNETDWMALLTHQIGPLTMARFSLNSGITTDTLSFEEALNAVQRDESGGFINPFSGLAATPSSSSFARSNSIYRQRTATLVLLHNRPRDSFSLTAAVARQRMIGGSSAGGAAAATLAAAGGGGDSTSVSSQFAWNHQLTPRTGVSASFSSQKTLTGNNTLGGSWQGKGTVTLDCHLSAELSLGLSYSYAATMPVSAASTRENLVAVSLSRSF